MRYTIELTRRARRQFERLERDIRERVSAAIDGLADNPRPPGVEKLKGEVTVYRIRVGSYRILYEIHEDVVTVLVLRIRHRRDVYRR